MLYLVAGIVVPLGAMYFALESDRKFALDYAWAITLIPALIAIGSVYFFFHREKSPDEEGTLQRVLRKRLDAGEALITVTILPLTPTERTLIRRLQTWHTLGIAAGLAVGLYMVHMISTAKLTTPQNLYISVASAVVFVFLTYKFSRLFSRIIDKGEKVFVRGTITNKYKRGAGSGRYNIVIGNIPYRVWRWTYLSSRVGDDVELVILREYGNWILTRRTFPTQVYI